MRPTLFRNDQNLCRIIYQDIKTEQANKQTKSHSTVFKAEITQFSLLIK